MSTAKLTVFWCDLCGYGGRYSRARDFSQHPFDVTLCRWCAQPDQVSWLESGGHRVQFSDRSWSCSCGHRYTGPPMVPARVLRAVPNLLRATAQIHVDGTVPGS